MKPTIPHRTRIAALLAVSALAVTGCSSSSSDDNTKTTSSDNLSKTQIFTTGFAGGDNTAGTPKTGGQLTIADYGEPRSLDPTVTYANGATGGSAMAAIYDELVRYDYTSKTWVPQLAESITGSKGNTVWTLKLRPGVKFTNGQPLDSAAVLNSLKYYQSKYAYQSNLLLASVASTKAPDAQTVVFTLRSPWSDFPDMLAQGPGMIMAPAAYANPKKFKPIGAGPFTFGSYSPGESLVLNANKNYAGGAPYLASLKFIWIGATDDQAKVDALGSGTADTAFLRDPEVVAKARKSGLPGFMTAQGMNDVLNINARKGRPASDLLVRQAINYAIDVDAYAKRTTNGAAIATKSIYGPGSPWYTASPAQYDPAKAKDLVTQAKAKGFNGQLSFVYSASPTAQSAAVLIKALLDAAGFNVKLEPLRSVADQVQKLYVTHDFDIAIGSNSLSDVDPYAGLASPFGSQSPSNATGWGSPEMDKALAELGAAATPDATKAAVAKVQSISDANVPAVTLDAAGTFQAWNKDVHGIMPNTQTLELFNKAWKG